jgi:hypothetical protein
MSTLDEITKEKQRISEALARVDTRREKLTEQLSELEATERVLALQQGLTGRKGDVRQDYGDEGGRSNAIRRAPADDSRKTSWRQAPFPEP